MDSDFVVGINKSIDAAKGETGQTYPAYLHNTLVTEKLDELAAAISEGGGGGGGTPQVQADWNETDTDSKAYIKNKPTIPDAQVQADWNESDSSSMAYIQNKPTISTFAIAGPETLLAGETTITISNNAITSNSMIIPFVDDSFIGVKPTAQNLSIGSVTLTFPVQESDMPVKVMVI